MKVSSAERLSEKFFVEANLKEPDQYVMMSFAVQCLLEGLRPTEIQKRMKEEYPEIADRISRELPMHLILLAAELGLLKYDAPFKIDLAHMLADEFEWQRERISVVHSRELEHVAKETAVQLLRMIRNFKSYGKLDTVHIGFAGGRLLRMVAENLAVLLQEPSKENPSRLVFHAMVAAFSDDDYAADPNHFINFFLNQPLPIDISFIPIAAPGIVEVKYRNELRKFREIEKVYQGAKQLNIIVSSGGDWEEKHSTSYKYLEEVDAKDVELLKDYLAVADLLWQPLSQAGPIDMDNGEFTFRPNTLVDLKELPEAIEDRGVRVLLALGTCGKCGKPKGKVLNTILGLELRHVTDIVTNSPSVYDALREKWAESESAPTNPR